MLFITGTALSITKKKFGNDAGIDLLKLKKLLMFELATMFAAARKRSITCAPDTTTSSTP
jgi:hypothetical protein